MVRCREPAAQPIVKWAGGKTQLLDPLLRVAPSKYQRYIEPFVGGGALFFALQPRLATLADANPELINLYIAVRDQVQDVVKVLKSMPVSEEKFYEIRSQRFEDLSRECAAARTIYLNKTCYNGLYRVNKKGLFNVPFGRNKSPNVCRGKPVTRGFSNPTKH